MAVIHPVDAARRYQLGGNGRIVTICSSENRLFFMGSSSGGSHLPRNQCLGESGQVTSPWRQARTKSVTAE